MSNGIQDLQKACVHFLGDILYLRRGERLLIYADEASDDVTSKALLSEAGNMGVEADILRLHAFPGLFEREKALIQGIKNGRYDALCEISGQYYYPSRVWKTALRKGCRIYSVGAIDPDSFIRCLGKPDHAKIYNFGLLLHRILCNSRKIQIYTEAGTHIACEMGSQSLPVKILARLGLMQRSAVYRPEGMLKKRRSAAFMAGQLAFQGVPNTIEGTAAIDAHLWPPEEIGPVEDPIILEISKGQMVNVGGCPSKALILNRWLDGKEKGVKHFCIGYHPGARLGRNIFECERVFGNIVIGIGTYPFHTDGIMKRPTLMADDAVILKNGTFIHDELQALQEELFRPFLDSEIIKSDSKV
jgi:2,5-dihydroxypyridine 5,6-dioxygenase